MATTIYGSYDHLVVELSAVDRVRAATRSIRIPIDDIAAVQATAPGERTGPVRARVGRAGLPAVVFELADGSLIAIHRRDAAAVAADLRRRGVGAVLGA